MAGRSVQVAARDDAAHVAVLVHHAQVAQAERHKSSVREEGRCLLPAQHPHTTFTGCLGMPAWRMLTSAVPSERCECLGQTSFRENLISGLLSTDDGSCLKNSAACAHTCAIACHAGAEASDVPDSERARVYKGPQVHVEAGPPQALSVRGDILTGLLQ